VALDDISGIAAKQSLSKLQESAKLIELYLPENRFDNELYFNHIFKNKE
jgi:hypothetical protein